jgi:phosphatidylserine/phosphatidylglycerophosphate/cardiolipin synthase-like enzyme
LTDPLVLQVLEARVNTGVEIRVIGKPSKGLDMIAACRRPDLRLHARAIIRDGASVFVGSQSLRTPELDSRREIGLIINNSRIARQMRTVFEADWSRGRERSDPASSRTHSAEAMPAGG